MAAVRYFQNLGTELAKYLDAEQLIAVKKAYIVARRAHRYQKRRSGEDYITHPLAAALILAEMRMDHQTIMATLLHDVLEDTLVTKDELAQAFGEEVAELVDGVSKLTQIHFESRAEQQAENFRKMVLAMVRDIRVIIVKLADRLHNMQTLEYLARPKTYSKAMETLEIYAPIANRLGMHRFYIELEDLCFRALYPMRYRILEHAVNQALGNRKEIIKDIQNSLKIAIADHGINLIKLYGRQKHVYSIYNKMRHKQASFAEIMDVYGFRIIVEDIDTCYRILGVVHNLYKPVPERFKDYIAIPKANGYQSLHTCLFGPYGVPIEVQIRTHDMDRVANNGVAAHWIYKHTEFDSEKSRQRAEQWMNKLLEMQKSAFSSIEFIETVKMDLFPDEVYVFTPRGDIYELPRGATAVDFAYEVHSDIGNTCVAAKIDRRLAPLSAPLSNGQTIEIITAAGACPNPAWLNYVVTAKARANIRHFLKTQRREESIRLGKRLLSKSLQELSHSLDELDQEAVKPLLQKLNLHTQSDLYEAIGLGNQVAPVVARHLLSTIREDAEKMAPHLEKRPLHIKGTEGIVVKYAECCRPIPGDPIMGFLQKGSGVVVHVDSCPEMTNYRNKPERVISLRWEDKVMGEFPVDLTVEVENLRGVLAAMASAISDAQSNIDNISVEPGDGCYNLVQLTLTVRDRSHLARVMRRVRALKPVSRIFRGQRKTY